MTEGMYGGLSNANLATSSNELMTTSHARSTGQHALRDGMQCPFAEDRVGLRARGAVRARRTLAGFAGRGPRRDRRRDGVHSRAAGRVEPRVGPARPNFTSSPTKSPLAQRRCAAPRRVVSPRATAPWPQPKQKNCCAAIRKTIPRHRLSPGVSSSRPRPTSCGSTCSASPRAP